MQLLSITEPSAVAPDAEGGKHYKGLFLFMLSSRRIPRYHAGFCN